jgi:hypothetical protein
VAGFGFRTIGRLVEQHNSINPSTNPINQPSLTVAGFGFRTIGRLVEQPHSINHLNQPDSIDPINHS